MRGSDIFPNPPKKIQIGMRESDNFPNHAKRFLIIIQRDFEYTILTLFDWALSSEFIDREGSELLDNRIMTSSKIVTLSKLWHN